MLRVILAVLVSLPLWGQIYPADMGSSVPPLLSARPPLPRGGLVAGWDLRTFNLLRFSEALDNAAWSKQTASIVASAETSPTGSPTWILKEDNTATTIHATFQSQAAYPAGIYTFSVYAKAKERNFFRLRISQNNGAARSVVFNLSTGVVGATTESTLTGSASITDAGGGWYHCVLTATAAQALQLASVYLQTGNNGDSYTGDGESGIYLTSAQLNQGTTPLPYVATGGLQSVGNLAPGGAALQRGSTSGADTNDPTPTLAGWSFATDDYGLVSQKLVGDLANHTVILVAKQDTETTASYLYGEGSTSSTAPIWGLSTGSSNAKHSNWIYRGDDNNSDGVSLGQELFTAGAWRSHAVVKSGTSMLRYWDGGNAVETTISNRTLTLNQTTIGARSLNTPSNFFNGTIAFVLVYNRALSPAEIKRLHERYLKPKMAEVGVGL